VERALYFRCRRGEPEALNTLLYQVVDRLYTAAAFAAPDERSAVDAVGATWQELLTLLLRPRVGGHLRQKAWRILAGYLAAYTDRAGVRKAFRCAQGEEEVSLLTFPTEELRVLLALTPAYAERIGEATRSRLRRRREALVGVAVFFLAVAAYSLWLGWVSRSAQADVRLVGLQQRIIKCDLIPVVRDSLADLPDPAGADRVEARVLEQASLALEEVANAGARGGGEELRYLAERVRQEQLPQALLDLSLTRQGLARRELAQAQLALEEVANL
jgi:hypothetical protein